MGRVAQSSRDISPEDVVIVSPDVGGVARARAFAKKMGRRAAGHRGQAPAGAQRCQGAYLVCCACVGRSGLIIQVSCGQMNGRYTPSLH